MAETLKYDDKEWKGQEYLPHEWDISRNRPAHKLGGKQKDVRTENKAYREGWERIFGKKEEP